MKFLATLLLTAISLSANGQGFIDLDFETANLSPVPPNHGGPVPIASALPGWSASAGSEPFTEVLQNAIDYGAANVSILGPNYPAAGPQSQADGAIGTLDGNYTVLLQSGIGGNPDQSNPANVSISQNGTIPVGMQSIQFKAWQGPYSTSSLEASFDGNTLTLVPLALTSDYNSYAVNISSYAGQSGTLTFTALIQNNGLSLIELDDIKFSPQAVPEPSPLILTVFGGLMFLFRRRFAAIKP